MKPTIGETVTRYDIADGQFLTLRFRDGKIQITAANMMVETGDEVKAIITDFKGRVAKVESKSFGNTEQLPVAEKAAPKQRRRKSFFTDEQKAEIIRRYKAGEGPKAIADSLGCARSTINHFISRAGATEHRTGQHLKKAPEPQPEGEGKEPV